MGTQSIKTINGRDYIYYVYQDKDRRVFKCCGPADKHDAKRLANDMELRDLKLQKIRIEKRIKQLEKENG